MNIPTAAVPFYRNLIAGEQAEANKFSFETDFNLVIEELDPSRKSQYLDSLIVDILERVAQQQRDGNFGFEAVLTDYQLSEPSAPETQIADTLCEAVRANKNNATTVVYDKHFEVDDDPENPKVIHYSLGIRVEIQDNIV